MTRVALIAQMLPDSPPKMSPALWDLLLVGGVALALGAVVFAVAAVTRRGHKHRPRTRHGPEILRNTEEHLHEADEKAALATAGEQEQRQRRKRRRRDHRPRNPTLSEAGGLPPARDPGATPHTGL